MVVGMWSLSVHRVLVFPKCNWTFQPGMFDEWGCFEERCGNSRSGSQVRN